MRTTIDIPDAMYRRLKAKAAREGRPVKALILEATAWALEPRRAEPANPVQLPLVRSKRPGTLQLDNARIYDVISFP